MLIAGFVQASVKLRSSVYRESVVGEILTDFIDKEPEKDPD